MDAFLSGFVSIIGCPNVGKSTLLNCLVGQKVSIVTNRAQTTRNKITGVLTEEGFQIVFLDTPGWTNAKNKLGEFMQKAASDSVDSVEAILIVFDAVKGIMDRDRSIIEHFSKKNTPLIAVLNKCDSADYGSINEAVSALEATNQFKSVLKISAKNKEGIKELVTCLKDCLVPGPKYFPDDMVTDQPERVICGEIIREKTLELLKQEIPHGIGVTIDRMESREEGGLTDIYATLYCERQSHKAIIIGARGTMLKQIGQLSRQDIEDLLDTHVNLQIWIKVKENWRNSPSVLHELGYE